MMIGPPETFIKVRCKHCGEHDTIDAMVKKGYDRKDYECIDCKVNDESGKYFDITPVFNPHPLPMTRLKKLMGWCFG